jgi:hypothetical protein
LDAFIDDGYTEVVGIEAVDGLHPAMEFTRRPFVGMEGTAAYRKIFTAGPKQEDRLLKALVERIKAWNVDRPVSRQSLKKMRAPLFEKVYMIVFGQMAPDYIVDENGEKKEPAEEDEEDDAGN